MPAVYFGRKNEPSFQLEEASDLIVIRTRSNRSVFGAGPVPSQAMSDVVDGQLLMSFPEAGVEVYRVPVKDRSVEQRKSSLRQAADIRFAGSVLVHPKTKRPYVYTENLYVRFDENLDSDRCVEILRSFGLNVKRELNYATNAFFVEAPEGTGKVVFDLASKLLQLPEVLFSHPELISRRQSKTIFPQQWHLDQATIGGVVINAHANVASAHQVTQGEGTIIAIIDEGIDIDHPELSTAGKIVAPRDVTLKTNDPRPKFNGENHGTACAGVACGSGVDGASGVAPKAKLMPIRLASGLGSMAEADAFHWAADNGADVISCSWGPEDGDWFNPSDPRHTQSVPLPASTRDAIDYALTHGRGGKGCVITWAAGNGNESVDLDGYASYPKVIAVAACNDLGKRSAYSDFGDAVWCSFPSNDVIPQVRTPGIWTTDVRGVKGYNSGSLADGDLAGNYTNSFGGTSSACPGAAGVAALILSRKPELRYFEVRAIMGKACDQIDPSGGAYDPATRRSKLYGNGRLNAKTAVDIATQGLGLLLVIGKAINETIPDLGKVESDIEVANSVPVQEFSVQVRLRHTYVGDLVITLVPPASMGVPQIVLQNRSGGNRKNLDRQYDANTVPALAAMVGKNCAGTWKIRVEDKAREDAGVLDQVNLLLSLPPSGQAAAPHSLMGVAPVAVAPKQVAKPKEASRRTSSQKKSPRVKK